MNDDENGMINQLGINGLRNFPVDGPVMGCAHQPAPTRWPQWKYIPVRRTALYIEQSLRRGLQWVVFEPNGPLWVADPPQRRRLHAQSVHAGRVSGSRPRQAYLVKCGEGTTSPYDIDRGMVIIVVGFAPLKPAEFVIITLSSWPAASDS